MDDRKVTIPLMVKPEDDIQFVEEDNDTISDNEQSVNIKRTSVNLKQSQTENVYHEIDQKEMMPVNFLDVPKLQPLSRSASTESSDGTMPMFLMRSASNRKKNHDYEKLSVASSKKSTVERITDGTFFRRRHEAHSRSDKSDDEEHILEALRHIVRKCTSVDPMKRPSSTDVCDLLSTFNEKS